MHPLLFRFSCRLYGCWVELCFDNNDNYFICPKCIYNVCSWVHQISKLSNKICAKNLSLTIKMPNKDINQFGGHMPPPPCWTLFYFLSYSRKLLISIYLFAYDSNAEKINFVCSFSLSSGIFAHQQNEIKSTYCIEH